MHSFIRSLTNDKKKKKKNTRWICERTKRRRERTTERIVTEDEQFNIVDAL